MKVAVLLEKGNFDRYSSSELVPEGCELIHFGNGAPDEEKIAASGAEIIIADAMLPVSAELISSMPELKLIQSQGVGYNFFDLKAAAERGIYVCNCAGANSTAVAEQAIMLMLSVLRNVKEFDRMVFAAHQAEAKKRCFQNGIRELRECHVGILGFGAIGRELAARLKPFGCKISYYDIVRHDNSEFEYLPMDEILAECDIISLHLPAAPDTINLINESSIAKMKQGAIIINTARGEIVDQAALARAIENGKIAGAGLDTLSPEPVTADNPLLNISDEARDGVVLSPHIGGITSGSFSRYYGIIWENVRRIIQGERPRNIVNGC